MTDTRPQSNSICNHTSSNLLVCESLAIYHSKDGALSATAIGSLSMKKQSSPTPSRMKINVGRRAGAIMKSIILFTVLTLLPRVMSDVATSNVGVQRPAFFQGNTFRNVDDRSLYHRRLQSPSDTPAPVTKSPTITPTKTPTRIPTSAPSDSPSSPAPTKRPTAKPTLHPSITPSSVPTDQPSSQPSLIPSRRPTGEPTARPSRDPTSKPTILPSRNPSSHPSFEPSSKPSMKPSGSPSGMPSSNPSLIPSASPTGMPSSKPSVEPSDFPTGQPSSRPSSNPSARPTQVPSVRPSSTPTQVPTQVPSVSPSKSSKPSSQPSTTPSVLPSLQPSQGPSYSKQEFEFFVTFQFDDLDDINDKSRAILVAETTRVVENALLNAHEEDSFTVVTSFFSGNRISELSTFNSTNFRRNLSWDDAILQHRRRLQTTISGFEVTLQIFVDTRSPRAYDTATLQNSIGTAFDTIDERTAFIDSLQRQDVAFNRINSVQVSIDDKDIEIETTSSNPWLYVGIGSGVAVAAISSFLFIIYRRRRRARNSSTHQVRSDGRDVRAPNEFIHVDDGEDQDVSTLGYPDAYGGNAFANPFADDDQQNESTISAAYDYKMAYGGAGGDLPSVSSAGGTKSATGTRALADDLTEGGQSRGRVDSEEISRISSAQEDLSLFEEDNSFDRMYGEDERIEVIAPPGKLGVVIDTPMNGAPMVHAIKETSVLADRVRIGDRLISVDGQDTTEMSAIRVSKLISSKAMNAQRRMVFLRPASRN